MQERGYATFGRTVRGPNYGGLGLAEGVGDIDFEVFVRERAAEEARLIAHHEAMRAAAEQQLFAQLESTTRWQAPSDRWLAVETDVDIFGLPDIGGAEVMKEESTWL